MRVPKNEENLAFRAIWDGNEKTVCLLTTIMILQLVKRFLYKKIILKYTLYVNCFSTEVQDCCTIVNTGIHTITTAAASTITTTTTTYDQLK